MNLDVQGTERGKSFMESDIKEHLSCSICKGILRRAVTVNLCLHSFCRKCLARHLRRSKVCPRCLVLIHPLTPSINIRSDYVLQRLAYKLFPDVFKRQLEKQKLKSAIESINQSTDSQGNPSDVRTKRKFDDKLAIFTGNETVSLCLQLSPSSSLPEEKERHEELNVRYLQCRSAVTMGILKRFIENKLALGPQLEVKIFYKNNRVVDTFTIADVACTYGWTQVDPMLFSYMVIQVIPGVSESSTCMTQLCRDSRGRPHKSVTEFSSSAGAGRAPSSSNSSFCTTVTSSVVSHTLNPFSADPPLEKIPKKRGRKPKKRPKSPSPPRKRFQVSDSGSTSPESFLSSEAVSVPCSNVLSASSLTTFESTTTGGETSGSKQADLGTSESVTSSSICALGNAAVSDNHVTDVLGESLVTGSPLVESTNRSEPVPMVPDSVSLLPTVNPTTTESHSQSLSEQPPASMAPDVLQFSPAVAESTTAPEPLLSPEHQVGESLTTQTGQQKVDNSCNTTTNGCPRFDVTPDTTKDLGHETKVVDKEIRHCAKNDFVLTVPQSECNQPVHKSSNGVLQESFCPQCGQKEETIDGRTSISSRRCQNCLCISTSITVFINHGQQKLPDDHVGFCVAPKKRPAEDPPLGFQRSEKKILSGAATEEIIQKIVPDIVPKIECPDYEEGAQPTGQLKHYENTTCVQRHLGQPPADLRDPQTKTDHSNGLLSRDRGDSSLPVSTAASALPSTGVGVGMEAGAGDRCTLATLTGNRYGRKQKSLESIIRQLQPRQMSPVTKGNCASPRVAMTTPVRWAGVSGEPCSSALAVGGGRVRRVGQGSRPLTTAPTPQTDNRPNSLLRKALTCSAGTFDFRFRRFPSPSKPDVKPNTPSLDPMPFNLVAPPIKRLKNMFYGLESRPNRSPSIPNVENRKQFQATPSTIITLTPPVGDPMKPVAHTTPVSQTRPLDGSRPSDVTRRQPSLVLTSANIFDAPLELTTKESRDRKWRESSSSRRLDGGDVLRASFPLFDNRQ